MFSKTLFRVEISENAVLLVWMDENGVRVKFFKKISEI